MHFVRNFLGLEVRCVDFLGSRESGIGQGLLARIICQVNLREVVMAAQLMISLARMLLLITLNPKS